MEVETSNETKQLGDLKIWDVHHLFLGGGVLGKEIKSSVLAALSPLAASLPSKSTGWLVIIKSMDHYPYNESFIVRSDTINGIDSHGQAQVE